MTRIGDAKRNNCLSRQAASMMNAGGTNSSWLVAKSFPSPMFLGVEFGSS